MSSPVHSVPPAVNAWSAEYLESAYEAHKRNPDQTPEALKAFFRGFELGLVKSSESACDPESLSFQASVADLVEAYRTFGHIGAKLDPFGREREHPEALSLSAHGLSEAHLDREVEGAKVGLDGVVTLRALIEHLEARYCGTLGVEIVHISDRREREWLLDRFERGVDRSPLTRDDKLELLEMLLRSEQFERFLQKRYTGEKRFSLEGSESLIPLLEKIVSSAASFGVEEIVLGMAHRGRLNVLNGVLGKTYQQIFTEFEDLWDEDFADGGGDVKYHRGYSGTREFEDGRMIHLAMASNPSHLEAVGPVVMGRTRAKQMLRDDKDRKRVASVIIHGDAAIAGQGVVAEALNMSRLDGYTVGGTIHIVVNNMVGFTTSPEDGRSSRYCTDIAKACECPVLHVNGEDPQAVLAAAYFAIAYRQEFGKDVFVDMWCYRRYGHNEQDEASFTQPILTKLIKKKQSVLAVYAQQLIGEGVLTEQEMDSIRENLDTDLDAAQRLARETPQDPTIDPGSARWNGLHDDFGHVESQTAVTRETLEEVCRGLSKTPPGFKVNTKLKRLLADRGALLETGMLSYADAESLAYGTLLIEGCTVRLSGQDSGRGTFSHRHAIMYDAETGARWSPLANLRPKQIEPSLREGGRNTDPEKQANFFVFDSPLSEAAVLGFEYGYSLADPSILVIWEAQFGDFVNGAQTIIDQFLSSAEIKWQRWSGLTLLLPHGYEGMGPEHSSCRMERFLQLCADDNMQVCYPTTAGQVFHMLRRQLKRPFRKPLIVATPKSGLRQQTSHISELMTGRFHETLDDPAFSNGQDRSKVRKVLLCSGKIFHELADRRDALERDDIAIIRLEQLYPLHPELTAEVVARYPESAERIWVQEEPRNMGAYIYIADRLRAFGIVENLPYIGREASATPASGSKKKDRAQQESILTEAVGPKPQPKEDDTNPAASNGAHGKPAQVGKVASTA